ncbi:hypothetical protein [Hyphomicrobium sp. CS1GBMeth3]|uniref:hypothetical protein n=1 Tax=Hyphomicrobium sp. CS1GBMeth3 TaxID=1892845 RepID=UPI000931F01A|nr:hypothetical protein [Hyphomicrobium sp. CS1GBMeth3]
MLSVRTAKIAALANVAFVIATVYYVTQIFNYTPVSEMPHPDLGLVALGLPPVLAAWGGARVARNDAAGRLLAVGLLLALAVYVISFFAMVSSDEPLAPLGHVFVSLGTAVGLLVIVLGVWLIGRRGR